MTTAQIFHLHEARKHALIVGGLTQGMQFHGPFDSPTDAFEYANRLYPNEPKQVVPLQIPSNVLTRSTMNIGLSTRARNCMLAEHIDTVGQLIQLSENDLNRMPGMGATTIREVKNVLYALGLDLAVRSATR